MVLFNFWEVVREYFKFLKVFLLWVNILMILVLEIIIVIIFLFFKNWENEKFLILLLRKRVKFSECRIGSYDCYIL